MKNQTGKLYLFPTPIGDLHEMAQVPFNLNLLAPIDTFFVEEIKTARRHLRKLGYTADFETVNFQVLNEHSKDIDWSAWLKPLEEGKDAVLLSEAGMPCVADPGAALVAAAQDRNIEVVPLTGPSSILLTLVASGLNGQSFVFHGYLPKERMERVKKLKNMERNAREYRQSQIFMDAPYRNQHVFDDLREQLNENTRVCIGCDVQSGNGYVKTKTVAEWRKLNWDFSKRNVMFIIG